MRQSQIGSGGQDLDLALPIADGGPKGCIDPAFEAHRVVIGEWAAAVWESLIPHAASARSVHDAKHRIAQARRSRNVWYGPEASMVATWQRLLW